MTVFTAADLPVTPDGRIYHLDISPDKLADRIILVGDPDRAAAIAGRPRLSFGGAVADVAAPLQFSAPDEKPGLFTSVEWDSCHRGLRVITGQTLHGDRVSIVTSGMGTPSAEIVMMELHLLAGVDLKTRTPLPADKRRQLTVIRLGTSGGLHKDTPLGSAVVSAAAVGLDNTSMFYEHRPQVAIHEWTGLEDYVSRVLAEATPDGRRFRIQPYVAVPDDTVRAALLSAGSALKYPCVEGITVSNSGFFAAQGRDICDLELTVPDIDRVLAEADPRFRNMEMEASALFHILGGLGHRTGAICAVIANRVQNTFDESYEEASLRAARIALSALHQL